MSPKLSKGLGGVDHVHVHRLVAIRRDNYLRTRVPTRCALVLALAPCKHACTQACTQAVAKACMHAGTELPRTHPCLHDRTCILER
eukprot:6200385-Pleurochrysis_carterae.AAC.3